MFSNIQLPSLSILTGCAISVTSDVLAKDEKRYLYEFHDMKEHARPHAAAHHSWSR